MSRGLIFVHVLLLVVFVNNAYVEGLGVNWGTIASHRLPPKTVVQLLQDNGIQKVKLFDSDESILNALAGSGIEVMIAVPNLELKVVADKAAAKAWVQHNVTRYNVTSKDGVNITYVAIGNEPFLKDYKDMFINSTLPALENIQDALNEAGIGDVTKATIPFNADVYLSPNYDPVPSTGIFRPDVADTVRDILKQMDSSKAPFIVNIYPFLSIYYGKGQFPVDFAFFDGTPNPLFDHNTGLKYTNVFDAMIDTLASALKTEGFNDMPIIIGEMGWPTDGDIMANVTMASKFYNGLMKHLASGKGTPLRPGYTEVYMFALFDEDGKSILPGDFERSWGIYRYDGIPKFPLDLSGGKDPSKTLVPARDVQYLAKKWCQLKPDANNKTKIEESMKWACTSGADCTPIADASSCNGLDENAKASYVFNSFYQVQNQDDKACDFKGLAMVTTTNISQPSCNFTIQIVSHTPITSSSPSPSPSPALASGNSSDHHHKSSSPSPPGTLPLVMALTITLFAQLM